MTPKGNLKYAENVNSWANDNGNVVKPSSETKESTGKLRENKNSEYKI